MKALKTIVATAVIVFALTTVAMAGARHVGGSDDAATQATSPGATETHQRPGVTLTDAQFARLLHAVNGQSAKLRTTQADRDRSQPKANDSAIHAKAQQRTRTHDGGGTHGHGTQSGSTHRSGTHDGGAATRDGGTHDGGTHDNGTHHE